MEEKELTLYDSKKAPFTAIRRELLMICDGDLAQAAVISIIDYFVKQRRKLINLILDDEYVAPCDERLRLTPIAYADFQERGLLKHSCETAILKLIHRGYVMRYIKKGKEKGIYYYCLNYDAINTATAAAIKKIKFRRKWTPTPDLNDLEDEYVLCDKIPSESSGKIKGTKIGVEAPHDNITSLSSHRNTTDTNAACSNF